MASVPFDYTAVAEPSLLVPRLKPVIPVQINWNDPITQQLTGCFLFQQENTILKNHVEHMPDMTENAGGSFEHVGGNLRLLDNQDYDFRLDSEVIGGGTNFNTQFSIFTLMDVKKPPVGNNDQYILLSDPNNANGNFPIYFDNSGSDGRLTAFGSVKIAITTQEPDYTDYVFESYCCVRGSGTNHNLYLQGGNASGGSELSSSVSFTDVLENNSLHFFSDGNQTTRRILADVSCLYVFNRSLSALEVSELHKDAYRFLKPI